MKHTSWLSVCKYVGVILVGSGLLAILRTSLFADEHYWAHTINDAAHTLWGMTLAWAWVFLVRRNMLDEARQHLQGTRNLLQSAGEVNERAQQLMEEAERRRDIDLEI